MAERIAIVGGGMGGLSAAYNLSRTEELRNKYDITVFQMGWRLGGKCATGRGENMRIEEHGIHGFLGSYYNSLTMMNEVYRDWTPNPMNPIPTYESAFILKNHSFHWERHTGVLKRWLSETPTNNFSIGNAPLLAQLYSWLSGYAKYLKKKLGKSTKPEDVITDPGGITPNISHPAIDPFLDAFDEISGNFDAMIERTKQFKSEQVLFETQLEQLSTKNFEALSNIDVTGTAGLAASSSPFTPSSAATSLMTPPTPPIFDWSGIMHLLDAPITMTSSDIDNVRRAHLETELFQVILRGIRDDKIETKGFKSIDNVNFSRWLRNHGASKDLMQSPLVVSIINLTFQFPQGDIALPPQMSAASYVQWALRNVAYVDHSIYLFAAGTGETIITPLYSLLKERGVKFMFFHELTDLRLSENGDAVSELDFMRQATVKNNVSYEPLINVKDLESWPNQPIWAQLENETEIKKLDFEAPLTCKDGGSTTLSVGEGKDFSSVILAMPPAALQLAVPSLLMDKPKWKKCAYEMVTTATQALQMWLNEDVNSLAGIGGKFFASVNFPGEMHGQLDFSKYIEFEDWGASAPQGLIYGCGVMVDPAPVGNQSLRDAANNKAADTARVMLTTLGAALLPGAGANRLQATGNPHSLDLDVLYTQDSSQQGQLKISAQYIRGNVYASDRYTQSPPGTKSLRINPLNTGIKNLTCAGDWVDTGLNVGSVEGAVIGGMLAAAAINDPQDARKIMAAWVTEADSLL